MQTDFLKTALMGSWIVVVGALGYMSGITSFTGWSLLMMVSLVPPVLMVRFWGAPNPTLSETIRKALR
ncbi:MAG: hypothetical protein AB7I50_24785 [Vicinamibacterales bacterium]